MRLHEQSLLLLPTRDRAWPVLLDFGDQRERRTILPHYNLQTSLNVPSPKTIRRTTSYPT